MKRSIKKLKSKPHLIMIDGNKLPVMNGYKLKSIIKGDQKIPEISAASIIAKVARDKMMEKYDRYFPNYSFKSHKGYYTKSHASELIQNGVTKIHRKTFAPIKDFN